MLVMFLPIFVVDTKLIYGYNFIAPLKMQQNQKGPVPKISPGGRKLHQDQRST